MNKDQNDIDDFFDLLGYSDLEDMNKLYCQSSECGKSYTLEEDGENIKDAKAVKDAEADENYCSKKCMNRDMFKDHECENPDFTYLGKYVYTFASIVFKRIR